MMLKKFLWLLEIILVPAVVLLLEKTEEITITEISIMMMSILLTCTMELILLTFTKEDTEMNLLVLENLKEEMLVKQVD